MGQDAQSQSIVKRHLTLGWVLLALFLSLGLFLEALHGFKVRWYVDLQYETRRLMWRLAHAHGPRPLQPQHHLCAAKRTRRSSECPAAECRASDVLD